MKQAINLKELAEKLELSQTTVSRALNGYPEVSERTRIRVQEAAAELNYRPSPSAATLATGKTKVIGHVVPMSVHRMINPHFADFLAGASETYSDAGYDLLLRAALPQDEEGIYRDFAARNRVDGVVVHGPQVDDDRVDFLTSLGLPFVVHGRVGERTDDTSVPYAWLDVDNEAAFFQATNHLLELGHKQIALVNGLEHMTFARDRRAGYVNALNLAGLSAQSDHMFSEDMTESYGYEATRSLLSSHRKPSAILYSSVLCALGSLRALSEAGAQPGKDVSLMTYDDNLSFMTSDDNKSGDVFFTSMQSSIQDAGKRLGRILLDKIEARGAEPTGELWKAHLRIGKTTAAPR